MPTLRTSTNLMRWQPTVTSNSTAIPVQLLGTNRIGAQRFYRNEIRLRFLPPHDRRACYLEWRVPPMLGSRNYLRGMAAVFLDTGGIGYHSNAV
jgi:hypothetical protein